MAECIETIMESNRQENENLLAINQDLSGEYEHLLSLCWDSATLSASFYVIQTMEMFIVPEITDLRPMFSYTHNLFRQLNPIAVMASGHESFLREVMTLFKLPEDANPKDYTTTVIHGMSEPNNFMVFPQSEKSMLSNRKRLWGIKISGFEDEVEKKLYLETHIKPHQKLMIHSAGNLLRYMDTNWTSISAQNVPPIITSLKVFSLTNQVLIDDSTYLALEIFSTATHPSGFIKGLKGAEQMGFSLYRLLNQCQSKIGCDELKMIFQQPTNDISELNKRYDTIEWCLNPQNMSLVDRFKKMLKQVHEISRCFKKILENPNKMHFWKTFRISVAHAFKICELCRDSVQEGKNSGLIEELGDAVRDQVEIMVVFMAITEIVDIDEGMQENKFIVQEGLDIELDQQKNYLWKIQKNVPEATQAELRKYFPVLESCEYTMVPELGFVVAIKSSMGNTSDLSMDTKFLFQTNDFFYYFTPCCKVLNDKYGHMYHDICMREQQICKDLIGLIAKNMPKLVSIVKGCAQLDCFMAMAQVVGARKYVRPQMLPNKLLKIHQGRHALMEERVSFIPNDIHVSESLENLITIITAPNSAGKSIYLKQVGIIVYLAHIGCFVPATSAEIGIFDSIYSHIHNTGSIHQDASSFLNSLHQMAYAMENSTTRSLILIDEFGSGTTVNEGKSLLVACIEELSKRRSAAPITLFSTHFLDIMDLCELRDMVKEITIESTFDDSGRLQPSYKIVDGRCPLHYANELHNIRRPLENQEIFTDERVQMIQQKMNSSADFEASHLIRNKILCATETLRTYLVTNGDIDETIKKFMEFEIDE